MSNIQTGKSTVQPMSYILQCNVTRGKKKSWKLRDVGFFLCLIYWTKLCWQSLQSCSQFFILFVCYQEWIKLIYRSDTWSPYLGSWSQTYHQRYIPIYFSTLLSYLSRGSHVDTRVSMWSQLKASFLPFSTSLEVHVATQVLNVYLILASDSFLLHCTSHPRKHNHHQRRHHRVAVWVFEVKRHKLLWHGPLWIYR